MPLVEVSTARYGVRQEVEVGNRFRAVPPVFFTLEQIRKIRSRCDPTSYDPLVCCGSKRDVFNVEEMMQNKF